MEKNRSIAIQGYDGSFHQEAAYNYFGSDVNIVSCATFRDVAAIVEKGDVDAGVIAIENSIAGSILSNYKLLQNDNIRVTGEIYLHIKHNLMVIPGTRLEDLKEVHSHPMAILQCIDFLENCGQNMKLVETQDTAYSAKEISENRDTLSAAIASQLAAKLYNMEIIAKDIHSVKNNYTRFLIIKKKDNQKQVKEADKASLYFNISHKRGALIEALKCFEKHGINMSKLQSYPIPSDPFKYLFHTDMEFDSREEFMSAVNEAEKVTDDLFIYGIYRKGKFIE